MASNTISTQSSRPKLLPSTSKDSVGLYIVVTCGKASGHLYLDRFANKATGKCVLLNDSGIHPLNLRS